MANTTENYISEGGHALYYIAYEIETNDAKFDEFVSDRKKIKEQFFVKDIVDNKVVFNPLYLKENKTLAELKSDYLGLRNGKDKNIYRFNNENAFTLIIFDSRDEDSKLCKDIISKQYTDCYNRDLTNWTKNGIIIYDAYKKESVYTTYQESSLPDEYKNQNIFDPYLLDETDVDEVFVCGLCIDKFLLKRFATNNEKLYVFEQNPFKINEVYSTLRTHYVGQLCMNKNKTKAYQAFSLFKDPIGNIKPKDNKALEILSNYSSVICHSFENYEDWENLEKVKVAFEDKIVDETFRTDLIDGLFGSKTANENLSLTLSEVQANTAFDNAVENSPIFWTGNTLALNVDEIPTSSQIKKLVVENSQPYSKVVTFKKNDDTFWSVNIYTAKRELSGGIHITTKNIDKDDNQCLRRFYTETGVQVVKVVTRNTENKVVNVQWFNVSGKKNIPVNAFVEDKYGKFVFDMNQEWYVAYVDGQTYNSSSYVFTAQNGGTVKRFSKSTDRQNFEFSYVYENKEEIDFNNTSLIQLMGNKYYCTGNKYLVEASLTDKQMYECLRTKSIV